MSNPQDIADLVQSSVKSMDTGQIDRHARLRTLRRATAETLQRAVLERDVEAVEFGIRRLHRLGVQRDVIKNLVKGAKHLVKGAQL